MIAEALPRECKKCVFYDDGFTKGIKGICRRKPPVVMIVPNGAVALYPKTEWPEVYARKDWCGEGWKL